MLNLVIGPVGKCQGRQRARVWICGGLTAPEEVMDIFPCCRDMMGLSNQALAGAATRPLLAVFEARPMKMGSAEGLRVMTLVRSVSSLCGTRWTTTVQRLVS